MISYYGNLLVYIATLIACWCGRVDNRLHFWVVLSLMWVVPLFRLHIVVAQTQLWLSQLCSMHVDLNSLVDLATVPNISFVLCS